MDDILGQLMQRARSCNHGLIPPYPEGAEIYIGDDCYRCRLLIEAANEVEKLRSIICDYYWAEREYQDFYEDEYNDSVEIKEEWKKAWSTFESEAMKHERKH